MLHQHSYQISCGGESRHDCEVGFFFHRMGQAFSAGQNLLLHGALMERTGVNHCFPGVQTLRSAPKI